MRTVTIRVHVLLLVAILAVLVSCASSDEAQEGTLTWNLVGQSSSGTAYRLRNARITVQGPTETTVWDTEAAPDRTLISADVPTGDYTVLLQAGWRLERLDGAAATPVSAALTSQNPAQFTVIAQQRTFVPLRFLVDTGEVDMTQGYDIAIVVDEAPAVRHPSCVSLPTTCGVNGNDSCCASPRVSGGTFFRGFDLADDFHSGDQRFPATLSDFRLDKYEVTVGRFRAFVETGLGTRATPPSQDAGAQPAIPHSGWDTRWNASLPSTTATLTRDLHCAQFPTWTDQRAGNENKPINCVTWYQALAFCAWDGGYLPTGAQWNYAAAGGDQQRAFAWSSPPGSLAIDRFHASYAVPVNATSAPDCVGDGIPGCAATDFLDVGILPAGDGRWGQSDLNGNVNEWVLDQDVFELVVPCVDCANIGNPSPGIMREIRGGAYASFAWEARSGLRFFNGETANWDARGFRCARAP